MDNLNLAIETLQKCGLSVNISDQNHNHLIGGTKHLESNYFDNMFSIKGEKGYWEFTHYTPLFHLSFIELPQCLDFICKMYTGETALPSNFKMPESLHIKLKENKIQYQLHPFVNSQVMILGGKLHIDLENIKQSILLSPMESTEENIKRAEKDLEQTFRVTCEGSIIIGQLNKYITQNRGIIQCSPRLEPIIDAICVYYRTGRKPNDSQLVTF